MKEIIEERRIKIDIIKHYISALFFFIYFFLPLLSFASVTERAKVIASTTLGGYELQVFALPEPVSAQEETIITLKVHRHSDGQPAQGGKVFISADTLLDEANDKGLNYKDAGSYVQAVQADSFGNYEFKTTFENANTYFIKVRIDELDGTTYNAPLTAGFALEVAPAVNIKLRLLLMISSVIMMTLIGGYVIAARMKNKSSDPEAINFLDIKWIKQAFLFKYIQPIFQVPILILFSVLIILAFTDVQDGSKNLSTKMIWTIWWAGIIFTFVFAGRMWCFMCPVGAISEWTSRIFKPRRRYPVKLRNLWIANGAFILITWLDVQLGVVRSPLVTGILLLIIVFISVLIAMFYQRRTFCRYLCPIGGIIGLYSLFSAVELRSKDCSTCKGHERKDCYLGNEHGYGCPMFEIVPSMDSNQHCNFCGECIKSCPKDNITLRFRPFFRDAWTTARQSLDQAALAVVLVGVSIFVTGDMLEPWDGWMKSAMALVPADFLGIEYAYTVEVITKTILYFSVSLLFIPGMVLLSAHLSNRLVGIDNHRGLAHTFTTFGFMFIPIGLSMHLAHNLGHLLNESLAVIPAVQRAVITFTPFSFGEPNWMLATETMVSPSLLYMLQMGLLLVFYAFSLYAGYRLSLKQYTSPGTPLKALLPMLMVSFVLMSINVYLLNMPMSPRHIH
ncbi:MAG: 4Fe-4S binding protein [Nitrospiraceae bacterium]|nr:MAG: 4Fe-4S binding protein [Nitrospiraceae bacterium]